MDLKQQGGFKLIGDTLDAQGHSDVWLAIADTAGNIITSTIFIRPSAQTFSIFPNQVTDQANITLTLSYTENFRLNIFDAKGPHANSFRSKYGGWHS